MRFVQEDWFNKSTQFWMKSWQTEDFTLLLSHNCIAITNRKHEQFFNRQYLFYLQCVEGILIRTVCLTAKAQIHTNIIKHLLWACTIAFEAILTPKPFQDRQKHTKWDGEIVTYKHSIGCLCVCKTGCAESLCKNSSLCASVVVFLH